MRTSSIVGSDMLSVLIVGCGNIAGGFDAKGGDKAFTHAGAYRRHGGFQLAACVDPDVERREAFKERWGVERAFADLGEALDAADRYDVVSICSPTWQHAADLRAVLAARPRLVFCEKPMTGDLAEAAALVTAFRDASILMAVNHTRRWDPEVTAFREALRVNAWGKVRSAVGYYNKGILNNGSHMIDLLHYLLGPLDIRAVDKAEIDFFEDDPTVPALLVSHDGVPVHLAIGSARDYALFELQLVTEKGVVAIEQGGFLWRERVALESPHFAGYRVVGEDARRVGGYGDAMLQAAVNIHDTLTKGCGLASTGESALAAQILCNEIRQRAQTSIGN